ncbi:conserved hypothetical protein [uncultured Sporomusa sp.]|uniref:Uncharacterized protein n=1 Tax=uncultured Sporomusa sp. TaxID=307249 RepID=A0A212LU15_9FIRM|nr:SIR2 family protein [uncultured Sporomusa sp.]SCM80991.1 conserved hypothetical protein [uncultured Sporomusa sp.]
MDKYNIDWNKKHILKISNESFSMDDPSEESIEWRKKIEPWLTAIFQSEHFSLLTGAGLTTAITTLAGKRSQGMERSEFGIFKKEIQEWADKSSIEMARGQANIEDDLRTALELLKGLQIQQTELANYLKDEIDNKLSDFIKNILDTEKNFEMDKEKSSEALNYLKSFLISFVSRAASRDRLQIFTTNYDRFIEYGCDLAGIYTLDRFIGKVQPIFRTSKIELDYHYNPPGIRGEPRYVEGVTKLTKLHGSIDWRFKDGMIIKAALPFGASQDHPEVPKKASDHLVIYPNSYKGIDTAFYPYAELFRDFASATCRPNSVLVTYGYGFGDSHINRIIRDMLIIPSTHVVIISYDTASGRIENFIKENNQSQFTLLIGNHFGDLRTLVDSYLPKAAIDRLTERMQKNVDRRGLAEENKKNSDNRDGALFNG